MNIKTMNKNGQTVAVVTAERPIITDTGSALDLIMQIKYDTGAQRIAVAKEAICEAFFILSTGLAGEILQKCINYQIKLAVFGDFSKYTSKPLHDFMYESNCGKDIFFVGSQTDAITCLCRV